MKAVPYYYIYAAIIAFALTACSDDDTSVTPEQNTPPSYTPNLIFIDFQDGVLRSDLLCSPDKPSAEEKEALRNERYTIDELVNDAAIKDVLVDINGTQFKRIHTYNPCGDSTYTIAPNDIALPIVFFHYIALELDEKNGAANDLVAICNRLKTEFSFGIRDATPNFFAVATQE